MIKVRIMRESGSEIDWEISTMETLAKFQAMLTEEVVKSIKTEPTEEEKAAIINSYLEDVEQGVGLYDFVDEIENNMPRAFNELIERALRDTEYSDIDEITDAIEQRNSAFYDIYNIVRDYA